MIKVFVKLWAEDTVNRTKTEIKLLGTRGNLIREIIDDTSDEIKFLSCLA